MVSGQVPLEAPCFSLIHQGFCGHATTMSPMWTPIITPQPEEKLQGGHTQVQPHTAIPAHSALRSLGDPPPPTGQTPLADTSPVCGAPFELEIPTWS